MAQYPARIALSTLDGENGFKLSGFGYQRVAPAGDLNGDGFADLILSAGYVMFGKASGFAATVGPSGLTGSNGYKLGQGYPQASVKDVNGDGYADLFVSGDSRLYVVFGSVSGFANTDLSTIDGSNGFRFIGDAFYSDVAARPAGDINHDGFADVIVGVPQARPHGNGSGASFVVFGTGSGFGAIVNLDSLDGLNGFKLSGAAKDDHTGTSVSSAGDINGDGFVDLIVGGWGADPHGNQSGASYVVFGRASGFAADVDLSSLDGSNGFSLSGTSAGDQSGHSVAFAGDVNGDGFADVIIGAPKADPHGAASGTSYVVFGRASGFGANFDLSNLDGSNGFKISGEAAGDISGFSVASAGDVNGDGFADVIVGAPGDRTHGLSTGASYVVFGKASEFSANLDLSNLDGSNGFKITGPAAYTAAGVSLSSAGDVNDDGFADLIVNSANASDSYVVLGRAPDTAVDRVGTKASQTLAGGAFNDVLSGLAGGDRLFGNRGDDILDGGVGNDTLSGGVGNDRLTGGDGNDVLAGGRNADLLTGGTGHDAFAYKDVLESTSGVYDTLAGFDANADVFDLPVSVTGIDAPINGGRLSEGSFNDDMAAAVNGTTLLAHHAAVFMPDRGTHAGETFLLVDANGIAGYQAREDFVFKLSSPVNIGSLSTSQFV